MKKQRLMLIISVMLIAVMVFMPSYAKAATDEKLAVVNTSGNYLIYIDGLLNDEDGFEFALSNSKDETNLVYENSATDDAENAVAYYDAANQKFADVEMYVYDKNNHIIDQMVSKQGKVEFETIAPDTIAQSFLFFVRQLDSEIPNRYKKRLKGYFN